MFRKGRNEAANIFRRGKNERQVLLVLSHSNLNNNSHVALADTCWKNGLSGLLIVRSPNIDQNSVTLFIQGLSFHSDSITIKGLPLEGLSFVTNMISPLMGGTATTLALLLVSQNFSIFYVQMLLLSSRRWPKQIYLPPPPSFFARGRLPKQIYLNTHASLFAGVDLCTHPCSCACVHAQ